MGNATVTSREISKETVLFAISGILNVYSTPPIRQQIFRYLEETPKNIIFDLSLVDYIDSAGLGMIVGTLARCKDQNKICVILDPSHAVRNALTATKLDQLIKGKVINTIQDAIKVIKKSTGA